MKRNLKCSRCHKEFKHDDYKGFDNHMDKHMNEENEVRGGDMREHHAANGFHGMVYKPTHFLAGEAGRERVDIYPMKKKSKKHHSDDYGFGVPSFIKGFEF